MRMAKGQRFMHIRADSEDTPVFSEGFLYDRVGKGDARFILGVAEEYEEVIKRLGTSKVWEILASGEQVERSKSRAAHALYASRRALNDAAAALCEYCKKGDRIDDYVEQHGGQRGDIKHMVRDKTVPRGDGNWDRMFVYPDCKAPDVIKALREIAVTMHVDGSILGIDVEPAPHKFEPASHPPMSWCSECWLDSSEDCHDEERIAAAGDMKH